jgi:hypothetical protein
LDDGVGFDMVRDKSIKVKLEQGSNSRFVSWYLVKTLEINSRWVADIDAM